MHGYISISNIYWVLKYYTDTPHYHLDPPKIVFTTSPGTEPERNLPQDVRYHYAIILIKINNFPFGHYCGPVILVITPCVFFITPGMDDFVVYAPGFGSGGSMKNFVLVCQQTNHFS